MLIRKILKVDLILFSLFLSLIAVPVDAKTGSGKATETEISLVDGITMDKKGNVYIAMREHNIISRIDTKGMMTRYAGSGESGFSGDGGPAIKANFKTPAGLAFDPEGNLYIADRENHRVRKVDTSGNISTFAGIGEAGFSGDDAPAVKARLNLPSGVVADGKGNLYISDRSNDRIRVVDKKGVIHKGIAKRYFSKSFTIADDVKIEEAELKDGLLKIYLMKIVPEGKKPKIITVK